MSDFYLEKYFLSLSVKGRIKMALTIIPYFVIFIPLYFFTKAGEIVDIIGMAGTRKYKKWLENDREG